MPVLRRTCVGCGRDAPAAFEGVLCPPCRAGLQPPPTTRVRGVGRVDALFAYDGVGADLVRALKFRNARTLLAQVADDLTALVVAHGRDVGAVTWLPTSASRRHTRGFDQAELLARAVARRLGRPSVGVFRRRPGPPQTGRSWDDRAENVVFRTRRRIGAVASPLVVIDDVCTTGSTMRAACTALPADLRSATRWFALARTP